MHLTNPDFWSKSTFYFFVCSMVYLWARNLFYSIFINEYWRGVNTTFLILKAEKKEEEAEILLNRSLKIKERMQFFYLEGWNWSIRHYRGL